MTQTLVSIQPQDQVASVIRKNFRSAVIFRKHKIDFCCGGKKTIEEVSAQKNLHSHQLIKELEETCMNEMPTGSDFSNWSSGTLLEYIVRELHTRTNEILPSLTAFADKVASRHGMGNPDLITLAETVTHLEKEMKKHMEREESILFPILGEIERFKSEKLDIPDSMLKTALDEINALEEDHENTGDILFRLRTLTHDYSAPQDACTTYSILFQLIKEFTELTELHVHLENNILFHRMLQYN
jgi:regulator of cell morphogenesis and NO signaling